MEPSIAKEGAMKPKGAPPLIALPRRGGKAVVAMILWGGPRNIPLSVRSYHSSSNIVHPCDPLE